jgi:hypothetical protein
MVRISKLLKGLKEVHYLVCFGKIDTLELDLSALFMERWGISVLFHNYTRKENVKRF